LFILLCVTRASGASDKKSSFFHCDFMGYTENHLKEGRTPYVPL
jgi:hypothetical protein